MFIVHMWCKQGVHVSPDAFSDAETHTQSRASPEVTSWLF